MENKLPSLPKIRSHKEKNITPDVIAWFIKNWKRNFVLEIKTKKGKIKPHQISALKQVEGGNFVYKIPDTGRRNPFDVIGIKDADPFIVICDKRVCKVYGPDMVFDFVFNLSK